MTRRALWLAIRCAACAGRAPSAYDNRETRKNEILALDTKILDCRRQLGLDAQPAATGSPDVCGLAEHICKAAEDICRIAGELGDDEWARGKCDAARASCGEARKRCHESGPEKR